MSGVVVGTRHLRAVCVLALFQCLDCDELSPEVIVINEIDDEVLVKDISFGGCLRDEVLPMKRPRAQADACPVRIAAASLASATK